MVVASNQFINRVKHRKSYRQWKAIYSKLQLLKTDEERLKFIYQIVDHHHGFHSNKNSVCAGEAIGVILGHIQPIPLKR